MKKIFLSEIGRREFLKASLSGLALATLPRISFAQSNPDVVVIGAGSAGLSATAYAFSTAHGADRSGLRAAVEVYTSPALKS